MARTARIVSGPAALLLSVGLLSAPEPAAAAPVTSPADAPGSAVTVQVDPSYRHPVFEGWGTSLVWFANITGGYPDEIRRKLVDMVFGEDGLWLTIARYNIGGGNAPDVRRDYMKVGATMEGFWKAPEGITHEDMDWWDPDNPEHWNWDADANQRWWVDQIKDKVTHWEAFSNSPPWFQTVSGYVSGGFDPNADQIREDRVDDFATYLVRVVEHLEDAHGIEFDTVEPLNEPNTPYWSTQLGPDGQPTGGRQEGAHAGPELQQKVILALRRALDDATTDAVVSAMDETNPSTFVRNWNAYTDQARAAVDQLNVHTYGTGGRTSVRDIAKAANKKLWMSEVEGSYYSPTDYTSMEPGLGIAAQIVGDLRELEPSAWVFWQPIEDAIPQQESNNNWGSIHIPFTCTAEDTLETCPIRTNTKFHTIRNFTHYIRPGDQVVRVDDPSSVAAIRPAANRVTVVHVNRGTTDRAVTLDLSLFAEVAPNATVTPIVTSAQGGLVEGEPVPVHDRSATLVVPAKSVTTFVVEGVAGVAEDAPLVQPGHPYRLRGVQSGRSLAPSDDGRGVVIRTDDPTDTAQLWWIRKLTDGYSNRERYALVNVAEGTRLAVRDGAAVLEKAPGMPEPAAQWIMSTTGDGTWTFVNVASGLLLDVTGEATADGSPVSVWTPTSGANQRFTVVDEHVLRTEPVEVFTVPGLPPVLPPHVTPVYRDGTRGELPVRWALPPDSRWDRPGTVRVRGTATDPLGRLVRAEAVVTVDTITATVPGRAKTYVGGRPELPDTVVGVGAHGGRPDLPVTWEEVPDEAFERPGVVTVPGVARIVDGGTVPATVRVQVTEPVETNTALEDGVEVSATFTESGYSPAGLRNGDRTDKAWSNWKPSDKNPSDTITFTLPARRDLTRVVTYFYRDGTNISFPASLRVQVPDDDGRWVDVSDEIAVDPDVRPAPVTDVSMSAATDAVRVVMTARPDGYMTVSEIELYAKAPGVSSDARAASIEVDGVPIPDFTPDTTTYQVVGDPGEVTATPVDPYATVDVRTEDPSTVVVTVTSEDRTASRIYRVEFVRP